MNHLGQRLRELRGLLSLYEVSKGSGVSSADLKRYEAGDYFPTKATLQKIAEYYEVPYEELRSLYFEDKYGTDTEEMAILLKWAINKRFHKDELHFLERLREIPHEIRNKFLQYIIQNKTRFLQSLEGA